MNTRSGRCIVAIVVMVYIAGCDKNGINHNEPPIDSTRFYSVRSALEHPERAISLDIEGDTATVLPLELLLLPKLQFLDWTRGRLKEIPSFFGELQYMEQICFYDNEIGQIAGEIGRLKNLTRIEMQYNNLTSIPDEICNLDKLNGLFLESNSLSVLPDSIHKLKNLIYLTIQKNPISRQEIERIRKALPRLEYFAHD